MLDLKLLFKFNLLTYLLFMFKFKKFQNFQKYEYREISKPNQTISEQINNFAFIFFNRKYKASYFRDSKSLVFKSAEEINSNSEIRNIYKCYTMSECLIGSYVIYSFYWHYKKGYFNVTKGANLVDMYICGKIAVNMYIFSAISFFIFKKACDPIMYNYFEKKEKEWDENADKLYKERLDLKEIGDIRMEIREKIK